MRILFLLLIVAVIASAQRSAPTACELVQAEYEIEAQVNQGYELDLSEYVFLVGADASCGEEK